MKFVKKFLAAALFAGAPAGCSRSDDSTAVSAPRKGFKPIREDIPEMMSVKARQAEVERMNRSKREALLRMWVTAFSLLLISLLLIGVLCILGLEMVVRLDAEIFQEAHGLNLSQGGEMP